MATSIIKIKAESIISALIKKTLLFSISMVLLLGFLYPALMAGIGALAFPAQSGGSMITYQGVTIGSGLIGQSFTSDRFFHGRVSSTGYNAFSGTIPASGSCNYAPSNPSLSERVTADITAFLEDNPSIGRGDIPADLLTCSASGLDPDISPAAADIQLPRIAENTGIGKDVLEDIIIKYTSGRVLGIFGEPRVNVLKANLEILKMLQ